MNMKKLTAILLAAILLMSICLASAEDGKTQLGILNVNGAFDIRCRIPEGYELDIEEANTTQIIAYIGSEDEAKPVMALRVAFNELLSDVDRLNDLSDDELKILEGTFLEDENVKISYRSTSYGTKLLVAELEDEYVVFYTIYKGFEIEFQLTPGTEPLNDSQIDMVISFLSDMDFVSAE